MRKKLTSKQISIFAFVKVVSFITPLFIYLLFTVIIYPSPNSAFLCLGIIGSFIIGLGMISVSGFLDKLYWGHFLTFTNIGIGTLLILISSIIMYTPSIYNMLDEHCVTFYFLTWTALIISGIWYLFFRIGISKNLREKKISKTQLDKLKKGYKNFWWYDAIHTTYGIGWLYFANKLYTSLVVSTSLVHLILGWYRPAGLVLAITVCLLCLLNAIMWVASSSLVSGSQKTRDDLLAPGLVSIALFVFPILVGVAVIMYYFKNCF